MIPCGFNVYILIFIWFGEYIILNCTVLVIYHRPRAMFSHQGFPSLWRRRKRMGRGSGRVARDCQSETWRPGPHALYLLWLETILRNTLGQETVCCLSGTAWAGVTSRWSDDQCTWALQGNITRDPKAEDTGERRQLQAKPQEGVETSHRAKYHVLIGEGIAQRTSSKYPDLCLLHSSRQVLNKSLIPVSLKTKGTAAVTHNCHYLHRSINTIQSRYVF